MKTIKVEDLPDLYPESNPILFTDFLKKFGLHIVRKNFDFHIFKGEDALTYDRLAFYGLSYSPGLHAKCFFRSEFPDTARSKVILTINENPYDFTALNPNTELNYTEEIKMEELTIDDVKNAWSKVPDLISVSNLKEKFGVEVDQRSLCTTTTRVLSTSHIKLNIYTDSILYVGKTEDYLSIEIEGKNSGVLRFTWQTLHALKAVPKKDTVQVKGLKMGDKVTIEATVSTYDADSDTVVLKTGSHYFNVPFLTEVKLNEQ